MQVEVEVQVEVQVQVQVEVQVHLRIEREEQCERKESQRLPQSPPMRLVTGVPSLSLRMPVTRMSSLFTMGSTSAACLAATSARPRPTLQEEPWWCKGLDGPPTSGWSPTATRSRSRGRPCGAGPPR